MNDGWPEGRARMLDLSSKINTVDMVPVDRRRRLVRADHGDTLDMMAVYSGRFDVAWRTARRVNTQGPQKIELVANMICSGGEHSDVLFWRGACAAILADLLATAGYMVRLVVAFGGKAYGDGQRAETCSCRVTVKEHGMPFDITSTSAVILPGFFRALGHAWVANHVPYSREKQGGGISVGEGIVDDGEITISHEVCDHGSAVEKLNTVIGVLNNRVAA